MAGYKAIEKLLSDLKKQRRMINIELHRMPEGKLMISSNGSRLSCFDIGHPDGRRKPKGIGRNRELVNQLARKAYLQEVLDRIEINIRQLEYALKHCVPLDEADLLKSMPKHFDTLDVRDLVNPAAQNTGKWPNPSRDPFIQPGQPALRLEGITAQEWAELPYRENTKKLEHKIHRANRGFWARSKSEVLVTGEYDRQGIFYRYDEVLEIDGEFVSPDIRGVRADGCFIYHEHLGLQDDGYTADTIRKLILYRKAGIALGKNLFVTFDDEYGGISMDLVRASIDAMYYPGRLS